MHLSILCTVLAGHTAAWAGKDLGEDCIASENLSNTQKLMSDSQMGKTTKVTRMSQNTMRAATWVDQIPS